MNYGRVAMKAAANARVSRFCFNTAIPGIKLSRLMYYIVITVQHRPFIK
jgi:hypothetical protein